MTLPQPLLATRAVIQALEDLNVVYFLGVSDLLASALDQAAR